MLYQSETKLTRISSELTAMLKYGKEKVPLLEGLYTTETRVNSHPSTSSTPPDSLHLRLLVQNKQLPSPHVITRDKHPRPRAVPRNPARPQTRVPRTPLDPFVPHHIIIPIHVIPRRHGIIPPVPELGKGDPDDLVPRRGLAVPAAVEGDVHVGEGGVEGAVYGGAVGLDCEARGDGGGGAGCVGEGFVGGEEELVAGLEGCVGEGGGVADCEAEGVAVPVCVGLGGVADWGCLLALC